VALDRFRMKWRRNALALRAWLARPAARAAARRAAPGLCHVVVPPRVLDTYDETLEGIADGLRALGRVAVVDCVRRLEQIGPLRPRDVVLVYGTHRYPPWRPPAGVLLVGVNVEQYPDDWTPRGTTVDLMARSDRFLAGCDVVLECNEGLLLESERLGRKAAGVLPFAWTPRFDAGLAPLGDPPYDVAFLGRPGDGRRRELLARLERSFKLAPSTVAWGRRRAEFLRCAKVQLNLHQSEKPVLEGHRFALCYANGAFLLSEPLPPGPPFRAGVHHAEAPMARMDEAIRDWLARPADRARIAAEGRRFFREEYTFRRALEKLLPIFDEKVAAIAARATSSSAASTTSRSRS
jgi:glycosyl transferase family 1